MNTATTYLQEHINRNKAIYLDLIVAIFALMLIYIFAQTAGSKLLHHKAFSIQMGRQPLPKWSKPFLTYTLPVIESSIIIMLLSARARLWGFLTAFIMMLSYSIYAYMAYKEIYGHVVCACGKIFQEMDWRDHFYVNSLLCLVALTGIYFSIKMTMHSDLRRKANNYKQ